MPRIHPVAADVRITATAPPLELAAGITARVDALWAQARTANPRLHDGSLFDMTAHTEGHIEGRLVAYRHWMALRADPSLRATYTIAPLAVTGVTWVEGTLLLGRRARHTTQDAGLWELVPAGTLDHAGPEGRVDPQAVLLAELAEELGVTATAVEAIEAPLALVEDEAPGVWDLVLPLRLGIEFDALEAAFATRPTDETTALRRLHPQEIPALLEGPEAEQLAPVSRAVLARIAAG